MIIASVFAFIGALVSLIVMFIKAFPFLFLFAVMYLAIKLWLQHERYLKVKLKEQERVQKRALKIPESALNFKLDEPHSKSKKSNEYTFLQWNRGIANTYDNICFYTQKIRLSNLPTGAKNSAKKLLSQATVVMDKLQELENIGKLHQNNQLIEHSSLKLELIESRIKKLIDDASNDLANEVFDLNIQDENKFEERISNIRKNGTRALSLLENSDYAKETYFTIKKILSVRLDELIEDYDNAKKSGLNNDDPDEIMEEALTNIERIITSAENEVINGAYNSDLNKLKANNRYFEGIAKK